MVQGSLEELKFIQFFGVVISRGSVITGGPTASGACENWRDPGAGAAPNPDEASGSVPVPGGAGCFRAEKLQQFFFVIFMFLK